MKSKNKSGFSLIEVMVAALLLAVLAIGGAAVMYQTGGNIQIQGNKRIALELANEVLERYQSMEYKDIPASDTDTISVDGIPHSVTVNSTKEHFPSPSPSVADEYKQIEVRVSYR
ncbi:MAG: prepilin-type N-terminal cleavage/methylation domain-containing protein, partial [Kiritimatiellales bacterium]|nr:prepilin-type N-terminal cleavage/methylation domain-containing protein [Kiritimatiellales bacterium]